VAVNAMGDVVDPDTGRTLAGVRAEDGQGFRGAMDALLSGEALGPARSGESTSIGFVATNVALTQAEATKVAQMAQDGLARTIRPAHTPWDGDTLFALSTGGMTIAQPSLVVGAVAAEAVARAVVRAVHAATGLPGLPSATDLARS
jgi:L-aminopeptidase/D-esterase-like protein